MAEVNEKKGQVPFKLGGNDYALELTFNSLATIEQALGQGTLELFRKAATGSFSMIDTVTVVRLAIVRDGGNSLTDEEIGDLMISEGLTNFIEPVGQFFMLAVNGNARPAKKKAPAGKKTAAKRKK